MRDAGSQFHDQGSNPVPLHWECGVLTTGLPGKSLLMTNNIQYLYVLIGIQESSSMKCHLKSFAPFLLGCLSYYTVRGFFFNDFFKMYFILFLAALGLCCYTGFLQLRRAGAALRCSARASSLTPVPPGKPGNSMFNFLRNCQIVFQSSCTVLHPHQQIMGVPISARSEQHLLLFFNSSHHSGCGVVSHCGFDLHHPND